MKVRRVSIYFRVRPDFTSAMHHMYVYNDPEPDVPKDVTPMAQCAFESLMFNVSAVYTN